MRVIDVLTNLKNFDCWEFKKYPLTKEEAAVCINALEKPERPKGKWVEDRYGFPRCNNCKERALIYMAASGYRAYDLSKFCPKCGADMRETENKYKRFKE